MKNDQLNCRQMFERLSEHIDGELDAELCACFDEHMQDCEPCQRFIATLRKTVELCREGDADAPLWSLFSPEEIATFKEVYNQAALDLAQQTPIADRNVTDTN